MDKNNAFTSKDSRLLGDDEAGQVVKKISEYLEGREGNLVVAVSSLWIGSQKWARNRAFETNNVQKVNVRIQVARRPFTGNRVEINFNQVDDKTLRGVCKYIEREIDHKYKAGWDESLILKLDSPTWEQKGISVWNDTTFNRTAKENSELVTAITERSEANGIMCFGSIDTSAAHYMKYTRDPWGREDWKKGHATMAECSATVRHPKGVGSGWAGASSFDINRFDLKSLGDIAFDKCMRSTDPVRIEPGRYQTILEPPATAEFARRFVELFEGRGGAELPGHPLYLEHDRQVNRGRSKLGLRVADHRLSISHDPVDPVSGSHSNSGSRKIEFLKDGMITEFSREYAEYSLPQLGDGNFVPRSWSFTMTGSASVSLDDMISNTKRGLLLTRVYGLELLDVSSALYTGLTRDGLWLIENGKITKAVRNFRWTESPMFIFNNVEAIGEAVPTMSSWHQSFPFDEELQLVVPSVTVPTIQINDFSFTSTVDAV